jgi:hypothetical protein
MNLRRQRLPESAAAADVSGRMPKETARMTERNRHASRRERFMAGVDLTKPQAR